MNIPNILTVIRFIMIPVFAYFLYSGSLVKAAVVFVLAGLTDILDGIIARKFNMITDWGKLADPLADKLLQITALILLTFQKRVPSVILIIVLAKEIFMIAGSYFLYKKKKVVSANWYGKLATVILFISIVFTLFKLPYSTFFVYSAVIATLFAFVMYSFSFVRIKAEL